GQPGPGSRRYEAPHAALRITVRASEPGLGQYVRQRAGESGEHVLAVEALASAAWRRTRPVDDSSASLEVDHPQQPHADAELLRDLVRGGPRACGGRQDFDGRVGGEIENSRPDPLRKAGRRHERYVGATQVALRESEPRLSVEDVAEATALDVRHDAR